MLNGLLAILIGYLLGSVSPAYFLSRCLKGVDIRKYGFKTAGASAVYKFIGLVPAVITAIIDLSKGLLAMLIASLFIPYPVFIYLAGLAAILGHIFPFYLGFKGGWGQATAIGIFIYLLVVALINQWFGWLPLLILAVSVIISRLVTRQGFIPGFVFFLFFATFLLLESPFNLNNFFLLIISLLLCAQFFYFIFWGKRVVLPFKISRENKRELLRWRTLMRPLAVLIPILYVLFGKTIILIIIGSVALVFILMDISRLGFKRFNIFLLKGLIIKEREKRVFSSMSFFTLACFIVILIFSKEIAIIAILFLIFGDLAAKYMGILFGRRRLFSKSLEGFLAYFAVCLLVGFLVAYFLEISFLMILVGAAVAAIIEVVPIGIDDNFTVGLISASAMYLLKGV